MCNNTRNQSSNSNFVSHKIEKHKKKLKEGNGKMTNVEDGDNKENWKIPWHNNNGGAYERSYNTYGNSNQEESKRPCDNLKENGIVLDRSEDNMLKEDEDNKRVIW